MDDGYSPVSMLILILFILLEGAFYGFGAAVHNINEMKLEKSRQMICENKYTISEIALMLGFNSIHYFSRAFTQKYHMAPSEYSKTLYKT